VITFDESQSIPILALWRAKYVPGTETQNKDQGLTPGGAQKRLSTLLAFAQRGNSITFEEGFRFFKDMYFDVRKAVAVVHFEFRKHFLGPDNVPAFSGKEGDRGEEICVCTKCWTV